MALDVRKNKVKDIIDPMEQILRWETNINSGGQKVPCFVWKLKFY
jgi:hypothetical protein